MQRIPESPRVPLGGDYWPEQASEGTLWGFADLHTHLMAHLAFGGDAFWGLPFDPEHPHADGLPGALASCEPVHGGLINVNPEAGHRAGGGYPDFEAWPKFTTLVHQQVYIDWLYRAYLGGLRLVSCLAVNNELLASRSKAKTPFDDMNAIQAQVSGMKETVKWVDRVAGGPGKGFLQIAYAPDEAHEIIAANKLAVVLGVEVDSLFNWRREDDLNVASGNSEERARHLISGQLDFLYDLGIRQITPVHLTNNAFGGTAIYMRILEVSNHFVTGENYQVEDAWSSGVRYRLDRDGASLVEIVERAVVVAAGEPLSVGRSMNHKTLFDEVLPNLPDMIAALEAPVVPGGHANTRTLTPYGRILLEEMMARGMVIDVDHMSQHSTDAALAMAVEQRYPVISSHGSLRDLAFSAAQEFGGASAEVYGTADVHKVAHEAMKRRDQVERIRELGGVFAPILNQGDIAGLRKGAPELADKVPAPCAGSATSWAQVYLLAKEIMGNQGIAIGSDVNGAAGLPGPRFGAAAAYGAKNDPRRLKERRAEIDRQTNGVKYRQELCDYRWFRFPETGPGGYSNRERAMWQAVAQFKTGFDPRSTKHPADDLPSLQWQEVVERMGWRAWQDKVDRYTMGLWDGSEGALVEQAEFRKWPAERQAAYLAMQEPEDMGLNAGMTARAMEAELRGIIDKWEAMDGDNVPLERCLAGPRRDFDVNIDGLAHYGLLPDFLQDMRNAGLTQEDLAPLFRGAHDYVQMWQKCTDRAQALHPSESRRPIHRD